MRDAPEVHQQKCTMMTMTAAELMHAVWLRVKFLLACHCECCSGPQFADQLESATQA